MYSKSKSKHKKKPKSKGYQPCIHKDKYVIDYMVDRYFNRRDDIHIEEKGKLEKKMFGSYDCELDCFAIHHGKYGVHVLYIEAKGSCNGLRKAYQKQIPRGVECLIEKYKIPKDRIIRVVAWGDEDRNIKYKIIK